MTTEFSIISVDDPSASARGIVGPGVGMFNESLVGDSGYQPLQLIVQNTESEVVGGIIAETYYGWCHVDLLWVRDDLRGQGLGRRLMERAEDEARNRGAKGVYLDTFSFQSPGFYEKLGYETFGQLAEFPTGHQRHFMVKHL